jgi:hypothetical protein
VNATSLQMHSVALTWHHAMMKNSMLSLRNIMQQARKTTLPTFHSAIACSKLNSKGPRSKNLLQQHPKEYKTVSWKHGNHEYQLMVDKEGCIYVPKQLQEQACTWYHEMLMHPSKTQTELTIAQHYTWKGMCKTVKHVCL